jgi:hypothetical protein
VALFLALNESLAWKLLSIIQMKMYADRHGHGFRLVNLAWHSTVFGGGRPDRMPAWARVPLLRLLYKKGKGSDRILSVRCKAQEQWVMYADTDIVIGATGRSLGQIFEAYRAHEWYSSGLRCQDQYASGVFPSVNSVQAANGTPDYCHELSNNLKGSLAPGLDPDSEVVMAGFNDKKRGKDFCSPDGFKCPNVGGGNMCSCLLVFRVPSPTRKYGSRLAENARIAHLHSVGRDMIDSWASSRLAPPSINSTTDPEDFLAMSYVEVSRQRINKVWDPAPCKGRCDYAGDQGVLNRAVLYGLPHRPFTPQDPKNAQAGRFLKHIALMRCDDCERNYNEPFIHMTGYGRRQTKDFFRLTDALKLAQELHGLHLFELFVAWYSINKVNLR